MKEICKNCENCKPSYKKYTCDVTKKRTKLTDTCDDWREKRK